MKQKMSVETKMKLVYSGELIIIALIALVLGILKITGIIDTRPTRLLVYNIISFVGAAYMLFDYVWMFVSKKHRSKACLMDKLTLIPLMSYLFYFDIVCFIDKANSLETSNDFVKYSIGAILIYVAAIYIFQGIYHFKYPTPQVIEMIQETNTQLEQAELEEKLEAERKALEEQENKEEEPTIEN